MSLRKLKPLFYLTSMFTIVNKLLILKQMFIKKGVLALLVAFSFSVLSNTEHLNHASDHKDGNVYVFECEYADNSKTPKLIFNEQIFFALPAEVFYLLNLNIHTTLLERFFDSRAPPSLNS